LPINACLCGNFELFRNQTFLLQIFIKHIFLGAFAKLRKTTISFVMPFRPSVRPSVRMEQLGSHWTDFYEIWYVNIFRCTVQKIEVALKSYKNNRYFTRRPFTFFIISRSILLRMRNASDKRGSGNQNTHFVCNNIFLEIFLL
jgi:hypothetical protein